MRILLVEDDEQLGESLHQALIVAHYACDWIKRGDHVLTAITSTHYDLLIMDVGLPGRSGLEVLGDIRKKQIRVPVLLLTANDSTHDKVVGLDAGADDYLTKPFDLDELYARIRMLLRRVTEHDQNILQCGAISFDCNAREIFQDDKLVELTETELAIMELLIRNSEHYVSTARLEDSIYSWGKEIESNTVQVYISRLRKRFGNELIETKRGIGYRIHA